MADIYPKGETLLANSNRGTHGEFLVRQALEKLPNDWVVIQDYWRTYIKNEGEERVYKNFESDFIVLIPYKGIVVIEVKDWTNARIEDGQWKHWVDGKLVTVGDKQSPLHQAFLASVNLNDDLSKHVYVKFKTTRQVEYRALAIMIKNIPDFSKAGSSVAVDKERADKTAMPLKDLYICGFSGVDDSKELRKKLENLFVNTGGASSRNFNQDKIELIVKYLLPSIYCHTDPYYGSKVMDEATASVHSLLKMLENSAGDISVKGCAGSGKTWIAVKEAVRLAKKYGREKRILYLCYNILLAKHISELPDIKKNAIKVANFHDLCRFLTDDYYSREELDSKDANLNIYEDIREMIAAKKEYYHYIFVDEAQDFKSQWWNVIYDLKAPDDDLMITGDDLAAPGSRCYFFSDNNQNLFAKQEGNSMPLTPTIVCLTRNLRNGENIARYSSSLLPDGHQMEPLGLPSNEVIILDHNEDVDGRAELISTCLKCFANGDWSKIKKGGNKEDEEGRVPVAKRQIVVLSPYSPKSDNTKHKCSLLRVDQISCAKSEAEKKKIFQTWVKGEMDIVLGTTIRSFKGLEADYVILTDVGDPRDKTDPALSENDFYVACTRAKYGLVIIPKSRAGADYARRILADAEAAREYGRES